MGSALMISQAPLLSREDKQEKKKNEDDGALVKPSPDCSDFFR